MAELTWNDVVEMDPDIAQILESAGVSQDDYLKVCREKKRRIDLVSDAIDAGKKAELDALLSIFDERFRKSRFVVSFSGEGAIATIASSWENVIEIVERECQFKPKDWEQVKSADEWGLDEERKPFEFTFDIGEMSHGRIIRLFD